MRELLRPKWSTHLIIGLLLVFDSTSNAATVADRTCALTSLVFFCKRYTAAAAAAESSDDEPLHWVDVICSTFLPGKHACLSDLMGL
mgnify:CR=1 FL=1